MNLDQIRAERDTKIARLLRYFGVIMAIFYFVIGIAFLWLPQFVAFAGEMRFIIAPLLLIYGCFRVYRLVKAKQQPSEEQQEHEER